MQFEVRPGQVLAGKYEVERVIGEGGMGVVVAARHIHLEDKVAIKFLRPDAMNSPEVVGRFVREARAAVRIKSEHVARVSDVGTLEGGEPYMVMEYLDGSDLSVWLRQHGALPVEQTVELVLQACEAIAEAHTLGIIHRDLKPANLFVVQRAGLLSVKVLDFGISKVAPSGSASDAHLTSTAAVMGSPLYMPPEQMAASKAVDARADIWALGVILYELLTASQPFRGQTLPEVCMKIATEPPLPLSSFRVDVPAELEAIIVRCLEKDRERRYPNVADLALALGRFGSWRSRTSVDRVLRTFEAAGVAAGAPNTPSATITAAGSDSASSAGSTAAVLTPTDTVFAETNAPWGRTAIGTKKRRVSASLLSAGAVAAVLLLGLAGWLARSTPSTAISAVASADRPAVVQSATASESAEPRPDHTDVPTAAPSETANAAVPVVAAATTTPSVPVTPTEPVKAGMPKPARVRPSRNPLEPPKPPVPNHNKNSGMYDER